MYHTIYCPLSNPSVRLLSPNFQNIFFLLQQNMSQTFWTCSACRYVNITDPFRHLGDDFWPLDFSVAWRGLLNITDTFLTYDCWPFWSRFGDYFHMFFTIMVDWSLNNHTAPSLMWSHDPYLSLRSSSSAYICPVTIDQSISGVSYI